MAGLWVRDATRTADKSSLVATAPLSQITIPTTRYLSNQPSETTAELLSFESIADNAHEGHLPLVAMIVLTQASVGIWLVLALDCLIGDHGPHAFAAALATAIGVVGVHAALLHLGRPWLAYRAFLGWRTSWLSREAIGFGLFMGAASVCTVALFLIGDTKASGNFGYALTGLVILVAAIGILSVICTGMIYIATRRELWGHLRTGVDFGFSMIGLGLVGASASLDSMPRPWLVIGVLCCIAATTAKGIDFRRARVVRIRWDDFSARSGRILRSELAKPWAILWLLQFFALVLSFALVVTELQLTILNGKFAILVICLVGQALHRWIYFASVVYRRMPGAGS